MKWDLLFVRFFDSTIDGDIDSRALILKAEDKISSSKKKKKKKNCLTIP